MSTLKQWPFKKHTPAMRAQAMTDAYRHAMQQWQDLALKLGADPSDIPTVETLDQKFVEWGETWHVPERDTYEDDEMVSAKVAGKLLRVDPGTIASYRVAGKITGVWNKQMGGGPGGYMYRVGDLYAFDRLRQEVEEARKKLNGK